MDASFRRFCILCSGGLWRSGATTHLTTCQYALPCCFIFLTWFSIGLQLLWECAYSKRPCLRGPVFNHRGYLWSAPIHTPHWQHPGTYIARILATIIAALRVRVLSNPCANYCNVRPMITIVILNDRAIIWSFVQPWSNSPTRSAPIY